MGGALALGSLIDKALLDLFKPSAGPLGLYRRRGHRYVHPHSNVCYGE